MHSPVFYSATTEAHPRKQYRIAQALFHEPTNPEHEPPLQTPLPNPPMPWRAEGVLTAAFIIREFGSPKERQRSLIITRITIPYLTQEIQTPFSCWDKIAVRQLALRLNPPQEQAQWSCSPTHRNGQY